MSRVVNPIERKIMVLLGIGAVLLLQNYPSTANTCTCTDVCSAAFFLPSDNPKPAPTLLPEEVVAIQLRALQENDEKDAGIETAFDFAAPENKKYTGPIDFFKALVKNPTYEALLNFKRADARKMHIEGDEAQQIIVVTGKDGKKAAYLFSLSRQSEGAYKGCWMTDSVIRLAYQDKTVVNT